MGTRQSGRMRIIIVLTICLGLVAFTIPPRPALSADGARTEVATEILSASSISWQPLVAYGSISLIVSGPDELFISQQFEGSAWPALEFRFEDNAPFPDGSYNYELQLSPVLDAGARKELSEARAKGDTTIVERLRSSGALPSEALTHTGHFRISGGVAVLPSAE